MPPIAERIYGVKGPLPPIEIMSHCVALPWVMGTGSLAAAGGCWL